MNITRFLCLFFISGCSLFEQYPEIIKDETIYGGEIKYNQFEVKRQNKQAEVWKNDAGQIFYIKYGKVERTYGLINNVQYQNLSLINTNYLEKVDIYKTSAQIKFTNPVTNYLDISLTYTILTKDKIYNRTCSVDCLIIEESFDVPLIKWSGKNYYLINKDEVIESFQILTPFSKKIHITHKKIAT